MVPKSFFLPLTHQSKEIGAILLRPREQQQAVAAAVLAMGADLCSI
jgi:hypothetical protein